MPVAVIIQIPSAAELQPGLGVAFGIEFHQLDPVRGDEGQKRDVVILGHGGGGCDEPLILHPLQPQFFLGDGTQPLPLGSGLFGILLRHLLLLGNGLAQFLVALADGGVACGLPRAQALEFAAQMVAGSAKLILESKKHPGQLKDEVCSPGGTTIQGVRALEKGGFRSAVTEAVIAAYEKNFEL